MSDNPLNSADVDGNTYKWMCDQQRESDRTRADDGDAPQYQCDCGELVPEEEWIDELKMCKECYSYHYGGNFISPDQVEKDT